MDGWVDEWVDGWMDVEAGLRIAYSNQKSDLKLSIFDEIDVFLILIEKW